jgi:UTP--glucose-1-phosphate uridylyltransferase
MSAYAGPLVPAVSPVRTAVVPAGGLGTRFLPFSRTVAKELLPLVDVPVIDYVIGECAESGIERVIIVGAPGKESLADYFRPNERVAARLRSEGRTEELAALERPERLADVQFVLQEEARGNGDAVLVARDAVGDEPFAMVWGDDVVIAEPPAVAQLIAARDRLGGGTVACAIRVTPAEASRYGVVEGERVDERTLRVSAIVEKPAPEEAPSDLAVVHGYVLEPEIFDALASLEPGKGGEIWLADAVDALARESPVWAVEIDGRRYDAGERTGYVTAFVDVALARDDTGPALRAHLERAGWTPPRSDYVEISSSL